jgi:hypothetical protein
MRKRIIISFVCIVSIFFTFDIAKNPILFKSVNSFSEINLFLDSIQPVEIKYIDELIRPIPYKSNNELNIYNILPKERYDLTLKNGYGNCSNYVFGASYKLIKDVKEFYILNFYPKHRWAKGAGHTVMLLKIDKELVIVDLLEGGLVFNLNQENLFSKNQSVDFKSYNSLKDGINPYFPNVFDYHIGIIRSNSVKEYFQFLEMIYIPFGSKKIEKYFYDGLAVFFGKFPSIIVNDRNKILTKFENFRFQFYLWWFRVIMLSILALFLRRFLIILNKKVNVWNIR